MKYSNDGLTKSYRISFNEEEQRALENSTAARDLKHTAESVPYNLSMTDWDLMKKVGTSSLPFTSFCTLREKTCFRLCVTCEVKSTYRDHDSVGRRRRRQCRRRPGVTLLVSEQ